MANWGKELLEAAFDKLAGGKTYSKLSKVGMDLSDPEGFDVSLISNVPDNVFTWEDGRRYKFTDDSEEKVPGGVTGITKQDFFDLFGDLPVTTLEDE